MGSPRELVSIRWATKSWSRRDILADEAIDGDTEEEEDEEEEKEDDEEEKDEDEEKEEEDRREKKWVMLEGCA